MGRAVVIDGPAGSGKSTTAIELARRLGFVYLDTGAMYRAVTLKFIRIGLFDFSDDTRIQNLLLGTKIDLRASQTSLQVILDNNDVTDEIRANDVDGFVSEVSAIPQVREFMQAEQRRFAANNDIVAEGRDLGTYVFPDADVKIFLVANLDVRARRRLIQKHADDNQFVSFRDNLAKRDKIDSGRQHSPLKKAADAIEVDTSNLDFGQQVELIYQICQKKFASQNQNA
jgi:cytidylate kinase